jgi:ABC-type sugar transport system permease subunit
MTAKKTSFTSLLFLVPAGVIYLSVVIIPVFYSAVISLFKWNGIAEMQFAGLDNFFTLFKDPVFDMALKNNLIWIILTLFVTMTVALVFAVMLNKPFAGRTFFRGFFYFPAVIASIAVAIIWRWIYNPNVGFINQLLKLFGDGYQQEWISSPTVSIYAIFFASL